MKSGGNVYCTEEGHIAIEKDYRNLVYPRPREKQEIYRTWPGLLPEAGESRRQCPGITGRTIAELKDNIIALELEGAEMRDVISALKTANAEKDKFIAGLIDDATAREREIDGLTMALREKYAKKE